MTAIDKLLAVARAEVGYLEKATPARLYSKTENAGNKNYTKYGKEMHKLYPATMDYPAAWCDSFVDWCFVQAFGKDKAAELLHRFDDYTVSSATYFMKNKEWHSEPQRGDQIFFKNASGGICHTGIVTAVGGGKVYTIEGNTSSAAGVVANGGAVAEKVYWTGYNRIAGYGRPNYSIIESEDLTMTQYEELKAAIEAVSKENSELKKQVDELRVKAGYYNYIDKNMPESYKPTIQKLVYNGYLQGNEKGELMLTTDMMRMLTILERILEAKDIV